MAGEIVPPENHSAADTLDNDGSTVQKAQFSDRVLIRSILSGGAKLAGQKVRISGWVKTGRQQGKGKFAFLEVNDGSCPANLQVMVDSSLYDLSRLVATGTCVTVDGVLKIPPEGKGMKQSIELSVESVIDVGTVDPTTYPLPKTKISAVARIRNALAFATHSFFQEHGFLYIHTPIITTSDCEGAGEMFQVTTLINHTERVEQDLIDNSPPTEADVEAERLIVKERGEAVARLKAAKASKEEITASVAQLTIAKASLAHVEERSRFKPGLPKKDGKIDYSNDFFGRQAFLTVSGQLQVETYACALSSVYTFGPTFRAENSHTSRHLAEFWMVEPEIAFADIHDDMNCAEAYVKYMCNWLIKNCSDDMDFMDKNVDGDARKG
ncbi:Aminoacyl-tRNA synthetase class II (D/K/N) [Arabidopsis thaliana x Arabidopsis arenosa]|uniref:Aminoacyl-tRNA synthetase class II (D/K/N) n=1 Tax=Arabidopsis thaliana x Arabidopsis arenosa TaxID=1240361 RepID=A0A8T2BIJ8_9BRAS|nr:Aminoacyl-tRNA synthetase class II (D/K/N) [Arabidopsis thaliana x Arabidopsis arenosa]